MKKIFTGNINWKSGRGYPTFNNLDCSLSSISSIFMLALPVCNHQQFLLSQQLYFNTFKYHVFAPMGRFQLESIYLYFPPSSPSCYICGSVQDRTTNITAGMTVENKGKLILTILQSKTIIRRNCHIMYSCFPYLKSWVFFFQIYDQNISPLKGSVIYIYLLADPANSVLPNNQ